MTHLIALTEFIFGNAGRLLRHEPQETRRPGQVPEAM